MPATGQSPSSTSVVQDRGAPVVRDFSRRHCVAKINGLSEIAAKELLVRMIELTMAEDTLLDDVIDLCEDSDLLISASTEEEIDEDVDDLEDDDEIEDNDDDIDL